MEIIQVKDKQEGTERAYELLKKFVDKQTLLLLSGGKSPDDLYKMIAQKGQIKPAVVAMIDERFGEPMHENSNEKMIQESGLMDYLSEKKSAQYGILEEKDLEETRADYDHIIRFLFGHHGRKVAIMGIGADGHTAGIKPDLDYDKQKYVIAYDDEKFGKRITLTFEALSHVDMFIILMFGEKKKQVLVDLVKEHDQRKLPAAFYKNLPQKVYLITDITV